MDSSGIMQQRMQHVTRLWRHSHDIEMMIVTSNTYLRSATQKEALNEEADPGVGAISGASSM